MNKKTIIISSVLGLLAVVGISYAVWASKKKTENLPEDDTSDKITKTGNTIKGISTDVSNVSTTIKGILEDIKGVSEDKKSRVLYFAEPSGGFAPGSGTEVRLATPLKLNSGQNIEIIGGAFEGAYRVKSVWPNNGPKSHVLIETVLSPQEVCNDNVCNVATNTNVWLIVK